MDIAHVKWMINVANKICKIEDVDDTLLIPLVILHDVGYSAVEKSKDANYQKKNVRQKHMKKGAIITKKILSSVKYPQNNIDKITHYVSVHDNWSFGEVDIYNKDKILSILKDLDHVWMFTDIGFENERKIRKMTHEEMINYLEKQEPSPIGGKKPFSVMFTKKLHQDLLKERKSTSEKT